MADYKIPLMSRSVTVEDLIGLPCGFRFHPTDEEIVVHYLLPKAMNSSFSAAAIGQADFNKTEPWDLPKIASMGDTERYYYCHRDRKYPTGLRTNRATNAGYWKATGKDKEIYKGIGDGRELVGMKKTLVFYTGRAPAGEKTNWVMHEYRLQPPFTLIPKDDGWVVSRVFHKSGCGGGGDGSSGGGMQKRNCNGKRPFSSNQESDSFSTDELIRDDFESLPPLMDPSAVPQPADESQVAQDLKPKAVMPISNGFTHPIDTYDVDQFINANDPDYYYASTSESLFKAPGISGYDQVMEMEDYKCKVEQHCGATSSAAISFSQDLSNENNNVEVSSDDQLYDELFPSTLGSMLDLSKLWDDY